VRSYVASETTASVTTDARGLAAENTEVREGFGSASRGGGDGAGGGGGGGGAVLSGVVGSRRWRIL
jgi:hypothetical protein